jgi:hypothetical protein
VSHVERAEGELPGSRRGYPDLRRAASREPVGRGLRPPVASAADLAGMLGALEREGKRPSPAATGGAPEALRLT